MRAFSTLTAIVAFALSVNAAAIDKRAVDAPVQKCIDDLNAAGTQLLAVTAAVNAFTSASGYAGALAIHSKEQTLESLIKTANTDCCATTTTVSEEDAQAVLSVVATLVPEITTAVNGIISKKSVFAGVPLATTIVKNDITSLQSLLKTLDGCLIAVTPADDLATAQGYVDTVNADFASADAAYGISA